MTNSSKHVCILGCGRSGTSIFGELFQTLNDYRYYAEPDWSDFEQIEFNSPIAIKVPRTKPGTVAQGLPFEMEELYQVFPRSGVIFWQVRHPLDSICSLKIGIAKNWGHHPRPHDYLQWTDRSLVAQCAHHWNYINTKGYRQVESLAVVNRFEDMIKNPLEQATECVSLAEVDTSANQDQLRSWANRVQDRNNDKFVEAECSKPYSTSDHTRRVDRWKENLSEAEIDEILPIVQEGASLFGYRI